VCSCRKLVLGLYAQGFGLNAQGVVGRSHPRGLMQCHEDFVGSDEIKLYNSQPVEDSDLGYGRYRILGIPRNASFIRVDKTFQTQ